MTADACVRCDSTRDLVEHHTSYEKDETVTLCRPCHSDVHSSGTSKLYPEDAPVDAWRDANVYLTDEQIEAIDELVDDGVYDSRSAAVREAVDEELFDGGVET